ncbi:MAG: hypothetical protein IKM81_07725 [Fibrobacter sp.]|nr:hypothetical protein [Fibrobacter sp.]
MKISDSIEAHLSAAVAAISQRNQAPLPGHLILIPVLNVFIRLAKASGFCLSFYSALRQAQGPMSTTQGKPAETFLREIKYA